MFSRAHLLIEKEYELLLKDPAWGIEAHPLTDSNIFEWGAKIKGLKDTLWEGGIFRVYVKLDENFNLRPPKVCFHTVPFHPNVDMITGQPCIEILDRWEIWNESYSLSFVLLTIQSMLSNPTVQSPVNAEAAEMIRCSPHSYRQMVLDCVAASQRVEAGLSPQLGEESSKVRFAPPDDKPHPLKATTAAPVRLSKLSFEDYHNTWCGIATSKTRPDMINPFLESIRDNPSLQATHIGLTTVEIQDQMARQVEEHRTLMYGQIKGKISDQEERAAKIDKLNKMKKIYLPPRKPPPTPIHDSSAHVSRGSAPKEEPWEREVDDLVAWSSKLDTDLIDV